MDQNGILGRKRLSNLNTVNTKSKFSDNPLPNLLQMVKFLEIWCELRIGLTEFEYVFHMILGC